MTTTTTTTRAKDPKDLRRPITSPITALVLLSLLEGPKTTAELAEVVSEYLGTNVEPRDVYPYLYYYRKKGWVMSLSPLWSLTESGEKFLQKYKQWLRKLIGNISHLSKLNKRNVTKSFSYIMLNINEIITEIREKYEITKDEEDILKTLLEHYVVTGSTYMYIDNLALRLEASLSWLWHNLKSLKSKRLVYVWRDGKVGLGKNLRNMLGL